MVVQLLQFRGHLGDARVEQGKGIRGVLSPHILAKLKRSRGVESADHHAVSAVGHHAQQLPGPAEHQVAPRGVELAEQSFQKAAVQLDVFRRAQIDLELALAIVAFPRADLIDKQLGKLYCLPMTYLIASKMMPIICSVTRHP